MADVEPVAKKSKPGPPVAAVMARVESPAPLSRESNRHGTHIGGNIPRLWYTVEADLYITSYVFRLVLVGMGRLAGLGARPAAGRIRRSRRLYRRDMLRARHK